MASPETIVYDGSDGAGFNLKEAVKKHLQDIEAGTKLLPQEAQMRVVANRNVCMRYKPFTLRL